MFKLIGTLLTLILGAALLLDAVLPPNRAELRVTQHATGFNWDNSTSHKGVDRREVFSLHFVGGTPSSCSVEQAAYTALRDDDLVTVTSSRLFKQCVGLVRNGENLPTRTYWKFFTIIAGILTIGAGIGWVNTDLLSRINIFPRY